MVSAPEYDVVLVGGGIMSSTLATLLHELDPQLRIALFERLDSIAAESSDAWNNAGTGHSAFCELNYTPENPDGSIDISKALKIAEQFEISKQFWASLLEKGYMRSASSFINPIPHCSVVFGLQNIDYLRRRHQVLCAHHLFAQMQWSDKPETIASWMPLIMQGRDPQQAVAATYMALGSDVDFGSLTRQIVDHLKETKTVDIFLNHEVHHLVKEDGQRHLKIRDKQMNILRSVHATFVFIGAGGKSISLLQDSHVKKRRNYGGFPVSGLRLVCKNHEIVAQHQVKAYGKADLDATPMSVPHLDTRVINGEQALLFGPYAGMTTKFLKKGSVRDLISSVRWYNIWSMIKAGSLNLSLVTYLIKEVKQTKRDRMRTLQQFFPQARTEDRILQEAGYRVQIIKSDKQVGGKLQFGTEVVVSDDASLATLLGASPGASTSVSIMVDVIEQCFPQYLSDPEHIRKLIPSYGFSLQNDEELTQKIRTRTTQTLNLRDT